MTANTWYLLKIVDNLGENNKLLQNIYINGYEYKVRVEKLESTISAVQLNPSEIDSNWTIGYIIQNDDLLICIKPGVNANPVKMDLQTVNSDNTVFDITPSKNDYIPQASRLLSDYTADLPSSTILLKSVLL